MSVPAHAFVLRHRIESAFGQRMTAGETPKRKRRAADKTVTRNRQIRVLRARRQKDAARPAQRVQDR